MRKAEGLLKEAEQKKAELTREGEKLRADAEQKAKQTVEDGERELDVLVRRRADIQTEISRVQDVLEALESFETPSGGAKDNHGQGGCHGRNHPFGWQAVRLLATQKAGHSPYQTGINSMTRRFGP